MKKAFLTLSISLLMLCLFAISIAATTIYKDENGQVLFECEILADDYHIDSYEIKNGGFAKTDSNGDALTWYLAKTETVEGNTVKTVKSVKTKDVYANGVYDGVDKTLIVSANYDAGTTSVPVFGGFSGTYNKELLFIYIPDAVTTLPYRFCQNVPVVVCEISESSECGDWGKLTFWGAKSLREIFIPKNFKNFVLEGSEGQFKNCIRLEKLTFHKESTLENWPGWYFSSTKIKSITVPDSITSLNSRAFQGMAYLEYANIGKNVTYMYKTGNNHSMFHGCSNLKTVVIPKGLVAKNLVDEYGGGFDYSFSSSNPTFIYTGTLADFLEIQKVFAGASYNGGIESATVENGRIVIADHCETYYGGHSWKNDNTVTDGNYFAEINIGDTCSRCEQLLVKSTIAPIFINKGYSKCTFGEAYSVTQGYGINRTALEEYKKYVPDFDFGLVAAVNKTEGDVAFKPLTDGSKAVVISFNKNANNYIDIVLTGITDTSEHFVFCVYATEGDKTYYLDNGTTSESVTGISYNNIEDTDNNGGNE